MTGQKFMSGKHWLSVTCAYFIEFSEPGFCSKPLLFMINRIIASADISNP